MGFLVAETDLYVLEVLGTLVRTADRHLATRARDLAPELDGRKLDIKGYLVGHSQGSGRCPACDLAGVDGAMTVDGAESGNLPPEKTPSEAGDRSCRYR